MSDGKFNATEPPRRGLPVTEADEDLREVHLIVRPEDARDVERAIMTVMPPVHTKIRGVGRGMQGGLSYQPASRLKKLFGARSRALSVFLPKTIFYLVLPASQTDRLINAISGVLRSRGGPDDCGIGRAIICPLEAEVAIAAPGTPGTFGALRGTGPAAARAAASGNGKSRVA